MKCSKNDRNTSKRQRKSFESTLTGQTGNNLSKEIMIVL